MRTKTDSSITELDLDTLDIVMGGSALPMGLGGSMMPQQPISHATAVGSIPSAGAASVGYTDHFGLNIGGGMPVPTSSSVDAGGPMGMGGSNGGASSSSAGATDHGATDHSSDTSGGGGLFTDGHAGDNHTGDNHTNDQHVGDNHQTNDVGAQLGVGVQSAFDAIDQTVNSIDSAVAHYAGPQGLGQ